MWILYLLGVAIALVIDYVVARKFADIAEMKGHIGDTYFWFTFLLGVIGMLMVVALPSGNTTNSRTEMKKSNNVTDAVVASIPKATNQGDYKTCPKCGMKLNKKDKECWSCGQSLTN